MWLKHCHSITSLSLFFFPFPSFIFVLLHLLCIFFTSVFSSPRLTLMQRRFHGSNSQREGEREKRRLQLTRAVF